MNDHLMALGVRCLNLEKKNGTYDMRERLDCQDLYAGIGCVDDDRNDLKVVAVLTVAETKGGVARSVERASEDAGDDDTHAMVNFMCYN
jgi:hypothetical protein